MSSPEFSGATETGFKLVAGATVAGRYTLERPLGRGGMGEVWAARHATLETHYAIKFVVGEMLAHTERAAIVQRFLDEAKATSLLSKQSRHIVAVHDYGEQDGVPYLVMEMLSGAPLDARLESGPLSPTEALAILEQVGRGLALAHRAKLVHRDLKPGNVFLCRDEDGELLVKILDFGLVRPVHHPNRDVTQQGVVIGTPTYMSPEQARGSAVDPQCDVWSMAVLSYAMLCGETPWLGETPQAVLINVCLGEYVPLSVAKPALGGQFDAFYAKAFQRRATARYATGDDLVEAFARAVAGGGASEQAVPRALHGEHGEAAADRPKAATRARSRRSRSLAAAALVVAVLLAGGAFVLSRGEPASARGASPDAAAPSPPRTATASATVEAPTFTPEELPKVLGGGDGPPHKPTRGAFAPPVAPATQPVPPATQQPVVSATQQPVAPATQPVPEAPPRPTTKPPPAKPHDRSEVL